MRTSVGLLLLASWVLVAAAADEKQGSRAGTADLILTRGEIYTGSGWAEAIAIRAGVIISVGSAQAVAADRGSHTQIRDLKGATVVPGLHDMHVHPIGSGELHAQCIFPQGSTASKVLDTVRDCIAHHPKGDWITGGQWDTSSLGEPASRALLDRVAPDNPVALMDISVHALWLNSKALRLAGITAASRNPDGGIIERDNGGEPSGIVRESARALVQAAIPPPHPEQTAAALRWALSEMLSQGITAFTDAGLDESGLQAYATLADQGVLKQRVVGCIAWRAGIFGSRRTDAPDPIARRNLYARDRFRPDCIKIILDGVPTDGHTAAMLEPYADASLADPTRSRGLLMVPPTVLNAAVTDFDARGLTVKFHAAGDAAVHAALDAIEAARKANGFTGILHNVGHNSFVQPSDIARARDLAATFEMSPYIWYPNPIIPDIRKAVGEVRMKRWIPVREAIESGALVVPGSDWAVVPSVNPWLAIETLVTRQKPGGGGEALGEAERISLGQAFAMFTVNSAREMGNDSRTGRIAKGMLADLLVLDRNPFKIPVTEIHDTQVRAVLINGELVHGTLAQ